MIRIRKSFVLLLILFVCSTLQAKEVTDTLMSSAGDRVILSYNIALSNGQAVITFGDVNKKLGRTNGAEYRLDEVVVLFFDRIGNYPDRTIFTGMTPEALMVPAGVTYEASADGYFLIRDYPKIAFGVSSDKRSSLSVPIYLAHYEKKKHYKVFSRCDDLVITLPKLAEVSKQHHEQSQTVSEVTVTQEIEESSFTDVDEARIRVRKVQGLLAEQEAYPFSDELRQAISSLRDRSYRITDNKLLADINDVLSACKLKEERLKDSTEAAALAAQEEAERKAKLIDDSLKARQDSVEAAARQQAAADKKQNMWMIIGGIILAVLVFVGGQVLQHIRNVKNQKSIMEMQENVVKRAENEAKRRARNMAQSQMNRAEGEIRQKTRSAVSQGVGKITKGKGKGNKGISI